MKSEVSGGHHRGLKLSVGYEPFWREGKAYRNVCTGSCGPTFKTFCAEGLHFYPRTTPRSYM